MEEKNKRAAGTKGEEIAIDYLQKNGYTILDKNFRVGRMGEIDIIARESEYICFIEVKTRSSTVFGMPCEAVDRRKQERITRLSQVYISRRHLHDRNIRFDIAEVFKEKAGVRVNLIKNAF